MNKDAILHNLKQEYSSKPNRLKHVLGVQETAVKLGKIHHCDINKLEIAALLHDITKYYNKETNTKLIKQYFPDADEILTEYNDGILHAYSAYVVAKELYNISDNDILNAILYHTIGKPNMTIYEKIIFISDYIEPNRVYDSCRKVRDIAFKDIDLAVYTAIDDSIKLYENLHSQVPKKAYETRTYYKKLLEERI